MSCLGVRRSTAFFNASQVTSKQAKYEQSRSGDFATSGATFSPMKLLRAFAGVPLLMVAGCTSSGPAMVCNCPADVFEVTVPADRVDDVKSVAATGACSNASFDSGRIFISEDGVGTCHIVVVFKSGAPEFDADVPLMRGAFACETVCSPTPSSPVVIPEVADEGAGGAQ